MTYNEYFCFVNETKLTEAEWNIVHAEEVANGYRDTYGYQHCNSYIAYSKSFDRCMAKQLALRDDLAKEYRWLTDHDFNAEWDARYSDYSDSYKGCYGTRPHSRGELLKAKGLPENTPWAC